MYRLDYGHEKIGKPTFFCHFRLRLLGIPMRLGSQSEVIIINVKAKIKRAVKMTALLLSINS